MTPVTNRNNIMVYYIALLLNLYILIFGNYFKGITTFLISIICWGAIYLITKKESSIEFVLVRLILFSIPLSFINIMGRAYGELPISWFNIFFIIFVFYFVIENLTNKRMRFNYLALFSLFLIFIGLIPLIKSLYLIDGLKQYINFSIPFIFIIAAVGLKNKMDTLEKNQLKIDYLKATKIAAIGVFVQVLFYLFGKEIGYMAIYGGNRLAFGFLFSDFSFLSLYIVTGAMMIIMLDKEYTQSKYKKGTEIILLLIASILTSARTGIFSFIIVYIVYNCYRFLKFLLKGSVQIIYISLFSVGIIIGSFFLVSNIRLDFAMDSGRSLLNKLAFNVFMENPLTGIGFGVNTYGDLISTIPHNLLFQFLAQGGLILTVPLICFLLYLLYIAYKKNKKLLPVIGVVLVGALLIPDIFNSRYLAALFLLLSLKT